MWTHVHNNKAHNTHAFSPVVRRGLPKLVSQKAEYLKDMHLSNQNWSKFKLKVYAGELHSEMLRDEIWLLGRERCVKQRPTFVPSWLYASGGGGASPKWQFWSCCPLVCYNHPPTLLHHLPPSLLQHTPPTLRHLIAIYALQLCRTLTEYHSMYNIECTMLNVENLLVIVECNLWTDIECFIL